MAADNLVKVTISITTLDKDLSLKMEPRAAVPARRLSTIEALAESGIPVGVNIAPIIPGLTDDEIPEILKQSAEAGAQFAGYIMLRLPFNTKEMFREWIQSNYPDKAAKVENRIREMRGGKLYSNEHYTRFEGEGEYAALIKNLFNVSCVKHKLNKQLTPLNRSLFTRPGSQLSFFG